MKLPTKVPCQKVLMPSRIRLLRITSMRDRPDHGAHRRTDAAGEVGAADDAGRDHRQLEPGAEAIGDAAEPPVSRNPVMPAVKAANM